MAHRDCGPWAVELWPVGLWPVGLWPVGLWPVGLWLGLCGVMETVEYSDSDLIILAPLISRGLHVKRFFALDSTKRSVL